MQDDAARAKEQKAKNDAQAGRDSKALDAETEAARKEKAERSAEEHKKHMQDDAARAKEQKAKNDAQVGRDSKGLSEETKRLRREKAEQRAKEKAEQAARLA